MNGSSAVCRTREVAGADLLPLREIGDDDGLADQPVVLNEVLVPGPIQVDGTELDPAALEIWSSGAKLRSSHSRVSRSMRTQVAQRTSLLKCVTRTASAATPGCVVTTSWRTAGRPDACRAICTAAQQPAAARPIRVHLRTRFMVNSGASSLRPATVPCRSPSRCHQWRAQV